MKATVVRPIAGLPSFTLVRRLLLLVLLQLAAAALTNASTFDDGIPDEWRARYFGPDFASNPDAIAIADPDGDGANNHLEYLTGTDPTDNTQFDRVPVRVSTYAGSKRGWQDGDRTSALFDNPRDIAWDPLGRLWVTETSDNSFTPTANRIRVMDPNGNVTTLTGAAEPGTTDGPLADARFNTPQTPVFDSHGSAFIADVYNHRIRKISVDGVVSTFAGSTAGYRDGIGTNAQFHTVQSLCIDAQDNIYVADWDNICIRKVTPAGEVTLFAGAPSARGFVDGPRLQARFNTPDQMVVAPNGEIFLTDWINGAVRVISTQGVVRTLATGITYAHRILLDPQSNVYATWGVPGPVTFLDMYRPDGTLAWRVGSPERIGFQDGPIETARFAYAFSPALLPGGDLVITDQLNHRLRQIHLGPRPLLVIHGESPFTDSTWVTLTTIATNGTIQFTTDGSDPTAESPRYLEPFLIHATTTVKARLYVKTTPVSDIVTATFVEFVPPPVCTTAPAGLAAWWPLNGTADDALRRNHATTTGQTAFVPGRVGQALSFESSDAGLRVPASATIDLGAGPGLTLETWIRPTDLSRRSPIFEWNDGQGTFGLHLYILGPEEFELGAGNLFANLLDTEGHSHHVSAPGGTLTPDVFQHVALTYDKASGAARLYRNGAEVASANLGSFAPNTTGDLYLARRPSGDIITSLPGALDEPSVYARALSAEEIQAITDAGIAGKCPPAAPSIVVPPESLTVEVGTTASFQVVATGFQPLSYQWYIDEQPLPGETNATLTLENVTLAHASAYSVLISNLIGTMRTPPALLTVVLPPTRVRVDDVVAPSGQTVEVPVTLSAVGVENALGFSLVFPTFHLRFLDAVLAPGSPPDLSLTVNPINAEVGHIGLALSLPAGGSLPAGTYPLVLVRFQLEAQPDDAQIPIGFDDQPITRQVADSLAVLLPAEFLGGTVTSTGVAFEADVSPRPTGDQALTITDWVQLGRLVAGLDTLQPGEFQAADCAPRATRGNGQLGITDWIQGGRYAAKLDPLTALGGPSAPALSAGATTLRVAAAAPGARVMSVSPTQSQAGTIVTVPIQLQAQGDENALGFSLQFDPSKLAFAGILPGSDLAGGGIANLNPKQANTGRIGIAVAKPAGTTIAAGLREVVRLRFSSVNGAVGTYGLTFVDQPIAREVGDSAAQTLSATYTSGSVTLSKPGPLLRISRSPGGLSLYWPASEGTFNLWASPTPNGQWQQLDVTPRDLNGLKIVFLPDGPGPTFFRLQQAAQ